MIDFQALRAANPIADVVGAYVDLRKSGTEYTARCPFHADKNPSFHVVPKKEHAFCNACGWHGDCIKFVAEFESVSVSEAARRLGHHELPTSRPPPAPLPPDLSDEWAQIAIPDGQRMPAAGQAWTVYNPKRGRVWEFTPARVWPYLGAAGELLGYVARVEFSPTEKVTPTITYCKHRDTGEERWCSRPFAEPRPLLGLPDLIARPTAPVLLVSGEKCKDAGARLLPGFVAITWPGGDHGWRSVDWAPLHGRNVTAWHDLDRQADRQGNRKPYAEQSGVASMAAILAGLAPFGGQLRMLDLSEDFAWLELPNGWDIADAEADGWDRARTIAFCGSRVKPFVPPTPKTEAEPAEESGRGNPTDPADVAVAAHREERAAGSAGDDDTEHRGPAPPDNHRTRREIMADLPSRDIWPEPINLLGQFEPPIITPEWLPAPLVDYVFDQADLLGCDPSIVALSCVVACAAALHDGIEIQPKRFDPTWTEQARLWGAIVGDPSIRKTPAIKKATSHLRKIDIQLAEQSAGKIAEFERQAKVNKKLEASWVKRAANGTAPGSPPEPVERPAAERLIAEDITVEALSNVLKDNARGVLVMTDELSGWFGSMDAYKAAGGKDRGLWLEVYNGGPKRVDRVLRGSLLVPNWSASILGGIQPEAIRKVAGSLHDDGLLQRFIPVCGRPLINGVQDRAPNLEAVKAYRALLDDIFACKPSDTVVTLSPGAHKWREAISEFSHGLVTAEVLTASFRSHLGKWDGLFARLLLTFHAIEQRANRRHPVNDSVSEATAKRTHDFMRWFLFPHAASFYMGILGRSDRDTAVEWIATWILAEKLEAVSLRDIMQAYKKWRALPDWQQKLVMRGLEDAGWLIATGETPERRQNRWAVNPKAHALFEQFAGAAKARRDASRRAVVAAFKPHHDEPDNTDNEDNA